MITWLQVATVVGLGIILGSGLQRSAFGNVAVSARLLRGSSIGWTEGRLDFGGAFALPIWAEGDLLVRTSSLNARAWVSHAGQSASPTFAAPVTVDTAKQQKLGTEQSHIHPGSMSDEIGLIADAPFWLHIPVRMSGAIEAMSDNQLIVSVFEEPSNEGKLLIPVDVQGTPNTGFVWSADGRRVPGRFGENREIYPSWPPRYPPEVAWRRWVGGVRAQYDKANSELLAD
jgi:hypothetical protein